VADQVRIRLLGGFSVELPGGITVAEWPSRRAAELVQLLALAPGARLTRDEVIDALWPRLDAQAGGANLRKAAHFVRRALNDTEALELKGGQVALFPRATLVTDVAEFEAAAGSQTGAAALYSGRLLPESLYEEWTQEPRARLHELALRVLRESGEWERVAELDLTDEMATRELMRAALEHGQRTTAIRQFGRLRTALRDELGLLPEPETTALYDECVAGLGAEAPVFVGRSIELATGAAVLGPGPGLQDVVVVRGPGGIGKSALCRELVADARSRGRVAIRVTAGEYRVPYAPITSAVEQVLHRHPGALAEVGERAAAVLRRLTPLAGGVPHEHPPHRHEVIGAVRRLLLATSDAVALVVDDLHLADDATIDLLLQLDSPDRRLVQVLAFRGEEAPEALVRGVARLERAGRTVRLDLAPLPEAEAALLAAHASPTRREPGVIRRIVEAAGGNPFLVLEVARSPVAGVPSLSPSGRDAVLARLVDLDAEQVRILERLALSGDTIDPATLGVVAGAAEDVVGVCVDDALRSGVLVVDGAAYRFRHDLVRRALIDRVTPHARAQAHRETAAALAAVGAPARSVARHWEAGGRPEEAQPWRLAAAREALSLGAYRDALAELDPVLERDPVHLQALRMRADALDAIGSPAAPAAYDAAAAVVGGDEAEDLQAMRALATIKLGDGDGALAILARVAPVSVEGRMAEALAWAGAAALGYADPDLGSQKSALARRMALQSGDTETLVIASWANAAAAHARGDLRRSVQVDLEETAALPRLATSVFDGQLCMTQRLLYGARPYADVVAFADALAVEADRIGAARGLAFAVTIRGEARLLSGDLDGAQADLQRGAELHRVVGADTGESFALQRLAEVAWSRGDLVGAERLLDEALAIARASGVGFHLFDRIYGTRVALADARGRGLAAVEEAEEAVRGPIETCPGCRITLAMPAAIAAAKAGDLKRADEWLRQAEYLTDVVMRLPAWDAAFLEARGHRAQAGGESHQAVERFRAAAEGFAAAGHPLDEQRCAALAESLGG
jgi:DNA-binding SARP family transcriptional activator/tetratricopeptide (TPR) repeat protein